MKQKIISFCVIVLMAMLKGYSGVILTVPDITIIQGDTSNVVLYFDFGKSAYTAFQFDIIYPDGISSLCTEDDTPIFIKGDVYDQTHSVSSIYTSMGQERFQCFSLTSEPFTAQSGILLNLPIKTPKSMTEGMYQAIISPIEFVQIDATQDIPESIIFNINVAMPIQIDVAECDGGHIEGISTGIYAQHSDLELTAVPNDEYIFKCWLINEKPINEISPTLKIQADSAMTIKAVFVPEFYTHTMALVKGWNWVSSYISEAWPLELFNLHATRIVSQYEELINDPQYGIVGGLTQLASGMAYKVEVRENFAIDFRGHLYSVPMELKKGWNWVAYPYTVSREINAAISSAEEGDYLISQRGFAEFADGYWEGNLTMLIPGEGYLYKSVSDKNLGYDVTYIPLDINTNKNYVSRLLSANDSLDIYAYPNTMNITARLYKNGAEMSGDNYLIYAMSGTELRGVAEFIGNNYYLTVYGDQPVEITFYVKDLMTGTIFSTCEHLIFRDDVVGSRREPFAITIGNTTSIDQMKHETDILIYDLQGRKVSRQSSMFDNRLKKGIYIVNGRKVINDGYTIK